MTEFDEVRRIRAKYSICFKHLLLWVWKELFLVQTVPWLVTVPVSVPVPVPLPLPLQLPLPVPLPLPLPLPVPVVWLYVRRTLKSLAIFLRVFFSYCKSFFPSVSRGFHIACQKMLSGLESYTATFTFFPDNVLKTVVPQYSNSKRNVTGKKRGKTPQFYWSWLATHVSGSKIKTINRELDE